MEPAATNLNVALDLVAALEMFGGDFGDEGLQIDGVTDFPLYPDSKELGVRITLTNGENVELRIEISDPIPVVFGEV